MSERVRNTVLASLAGSKRIIVAACAAIAMFLGAVSAGASVFVYDNPGSRPTDLSAVFNPTSADDSQKKTPTKDTITDNLSKQNTFQGEPVTPKAPLYTPPAPQSKNTTKKNPVAEVLRGATNSAIFQAQADLLDKLQGKTAEALSGITPPIDIPGLSLPVPSLSPITEPTTDGEQMTPPADSETPPHENPTDSTTHPFSPPPTTNPEN